MSDIIEFDQSKINRVEIINHSLNKHPKGRILTLHKSLGQFDGIEVSIQDYGTTMKIFITDKKDSEEDYNNIF